jgi:hypothetical protein
MKKMLTPLLALAMMGCVTMEDDDHRLAGPPSPDNTALSLDIGGLRLVTVTNGSTRPIEFGISAAHAKTAVALAMGERGREARSEDCDGVYGGVLLQTSWHDNGLDIFADPESGRFVGWNLSRAGLSTMNGVSVGTTRADLERAYSVDLVEDSTLEHEFWISANGDEGLGGVFDGPGRNARVATLWSGTVCQHR